MKIKQIIKRYRLFLVLALVLLILNVWAPELGRTAASTTWSNVRQMLSVIPPIFILLGLLDVWVDRETVMRYTGKGSGAKGMLLAFVLGSAAAGPLYAAFPVAAVMLKKGSSIRNVMIFLGAWSTTKIPMLTFEGTSLGVKYMLLRLCMSIVGIIMISFFIDCSLKEEEKVSLYEQHSGDK